MPAGFLPRLGSGIILSILALVAVWRGGWIFDSLVILFLLAALLEFLRMGVRAGLAVLIAPGLVAGLALLLMGALHQAHNLGAVLVAVGVWMGLRTVTPPVEGRLVGLAVTVFGVAYICGLGLHVMWVRDLDEGIPLLVLVLLGTWSSDTFAFFVGVLWGRRPLAPAISPAKTVEGLIGGWTGCVLVVVAAARFLLPSLGWGGAALLGAVLGAAAPLGDLLESAIKRNLHTKDASHAIPGHGGVLDRIDSLLLATPVAYYLYRFLSY